MHARPPRSRFALSQRALVPAFAPLAALAIALTLATPAQAVERIAVDTGPDHAAYYMGLYNDYDLAQTFTAAESGELTRVALPLRKWLSGPWQEPYPWQDLKLDVRSVTAAGKPGSAVLGEAILPHSAVDGSVEVTFPDSIALTRGEQYAVVASTETPQLRPHADWFIYGMYEWKQPAFPYWGGAEWHDFDWDAADWQGGYSDLGLKVYVDDGDTTKPTIDLRSPADGQDVLLGSSLIADFSCGDEEGGSGLAMCGGDTADGAALDTSSVGLKSFTVQALDNAGNRESKTNAFRVVYDFAGFFTPINALPSLNVAKAGSAVPVKFSLGGDQGLDVLTLGYPKSQTIACNETAETAGIEDTVSASESTLRYEADAGQYVYVWKTDKAWAGSCRQLVVKLADGTSHRANFSLR